MTNQIYPCLWFDGQAKEAAQFYCSIFKNSKITNDIPLVVNFELNGRKFMGLNGGPQFKFTPSISISVLCETISETNQIWDKLIEGGKAMIQIDKQPWSERYGWLQDKYGFTWQIAVVYNPADKQQMSPSMLFTDKLFGKAEEAVKFYTTVFDNSSTEVMMHYPKEDANVGKVMFSEFKLNGYNMIAMDGPGTHNFTFNEAVSLVVNCNTQNEIDYYWNKLTEGGEESMCGWLKDKFNVSWQIVPANIGKLMTDPAKSQRMMQEILKMRKLDMAALENA